MIIRWTLIIFRILILASELISDVLAYSFVIGIQVKIVYHFIVRNLIPLILTQMLSIVLNHIIRAHRELRMRAPSLLLCDELLLLGVLAPRHDAY